MNGLRMIGQEAVHQRDEWSFEHDVAEHGSDLLMAAASILLNGPGTLTEDTTTIPWAIRLWKKHERNTVRRCMIAGALCAAAIDVAIYERGLHAAGEGTT